MVNCNRCSKYCKTLVGLDKHHRYCKGPQNPHIISSPSRHQGNDNNSHRNGQLSTSTISNFISLLNGLNNNRNNSNATTNTTRTNESNNSIMDDGNDPIDEFPPLAQTSQISPSTTDSSTSTSTSTPPRSNASPLPVDTTWVRECVEKANKVQPLETITRIMNSCPDKSTILTEYFGFAKTETIQRVNDYVAQLEVSNLPQNEALSQLTKNLHPALQPLVKELRQAYIRGAKKSESAVRRSETSADGTHHGCNRLIRQIKDLQETVKFLAYEPDLQLLDTALEAIGKKISDSIIKKREVAPERDIKIALKTTVQPILLQVEAIIQGQINALQLFMNFIAVVEASLIMGLLRATQRKAQATATATQNASSTTSIASTTQIRTDINEIPAELEIKPATLIEAMLSSIKEMLPNIVNTEFQRQHPNGSGPVRSREQPRKQYRNSQEQPPNRSENGATQSYNTGPSYASVARSTNWERPSFNNARQEHYQQPRYKHHNHQQQQQQHQQRPQRHYQKHWQKNQRFTTSPNWRSRNQSSPYWKRDHHSQFDRNQWTTENTRRNQWKPSEKRQYETFSAEQAQNSRFAQHHSTQSGGRAPQSTSRSNN